MHLRLLAALVIALGGLTLSTTPAVAAYDEAACCTSGDGEWTCCGESCTASPEGCTASCEEKWWLCIDED